MRKILSLLSLLFLLTGCAGYVNSFHNQIDRDLGITKKRKRKYNRFAQYRGKRGYRSATNSRHNPRINPSVRRQYRPKELVKKRYRADDLNDNSQGNSLWAGKGKNNYLFTLDREKGNGDIVLINVHTKLKNEMTAELKRAFPDRSKSPASKPAAAPAPATAAAAPGASPETDDKKVHDRISSVIVEEVNQDHLLLRGRKSLLYKNRKRLVEIQALISRRDVSDEDTVHSDKILESNISVLR